MSIVLFEDARVTQLYPITVGRAAFAVNCGSYRLADLIPSLAPAVSVIVRPHLKEICRLDFPQLSTAEKTTGPVMMVNARLVPSVAARETLARLLKAGQAGVARTGDNIAAVVLPASAHPPAADMHVDDVEEYFNFLGLSGYPELTADLPMIDYPHDVVRHHMQTLASNLNDRLAVGEFQEIAEGVFAAEGARLGQYVTTNTAAGPIVLEADATVGAYSYLSGPAYLGRGARVLEHAAIKDAVSLGHTTKIGGEVEASVIEPYTNKQHHGFLGHSYLGSWVNLGAGTCNSDLKNTYGQVNMEYGGQRVSTGMQFLGAIVGDYAKSAINTGIFTGKTIGACSMVYGFVTTNVPSYVNYARLFGQVTELPPEVMIATQQRMFARRKVTQRPADIQLIHDMFELTRQERQLGGEPLSL